MAKKVTWHVPQMARPGWEMPDDPILYVFEGRGDPRGRWRAVLALDWNKSDSAAMKEDAIRAFTRWMNQSFGWSPNSEDYRIEEISYAEACAKRGGSA